MSNSINIMDIPAVRDLLGCDFGAKVSVPGVDDKPCKNQAVGRVIIHNNGNEIMLQVCQGHLDFILSQTIEHSR